MNAGCVAAAVALLSSLIAGCTRAPQDLSESHAAAIRDSVEAMLKVYRERLAAKDWDSLARHYADDDRFRWVEDGLVRYNSVTEVRQALAALRVPDFTLEPLEQVYRRLDVATYRYQSAGGRFVTELQVNAAGLVTRYPELWEAEADLLSGKL